MLPIDKNDNHTDIYDGKMANCCQKVRGNKTKQRPKQQQKQTKNKNKQTNTKTKNYRNNNETGGIGRGLKQNKKLTEWSSDVIIIIDLRETHRE